MHFDAVPLDCIVNCLEEFDCILVVSEYQFSTLPTVHYVVPGSLVVFSYWSGHIVEYRAGIVRCLGLTPKFNINMS